MDNEAYDYLQIEQKIEVIFVRYICESKGASMGDYAYTTVPGKIKTLLSKIREVGIPTKATVVWLKSIGFTSSNDKTLIGVLKFIGLTDAQGSPTDKWRQFRGANYKKVLGEGIRSGYAELFSVYPDANNRPASDIEHVFKTSSSAGSQAISKTVATFRALVEEAEFSDANGTEETHLHTNTLHAPVANVIPERPAGSRGSSTPSVHIDVQIHISPESSAEQIDQIFASMAKHLYSSKH